MWMRRGSGWRRPLFGLGSAVGLFWMVEVWSMDFACLRAASGKSPEHVLGLVWKGSWRWDVACRPCRVLWRLEVV
jgi:hypothetical protein